MNPQGDFQIVEILNARKTSDLFLVKKIATDELFVWRTILLRNMSKDKKENLGIKVRQRIQQVHPCLVKFNPVIEDDKLKVMYISMEFVEHGSLHTIIKKLGKNKVTHINEEIIIKILFQLLMVLKSIQVWEHITLKTIYVDENINVKLLNFSHSPDQTSRSIKMNQVGGIIKQLCCLTTELCNKSLINQNHYSSQLMDLIELMLNDNKDVKLNIDKILGHPVIVLNSFILCPYHLSLNGSIEVFEYRTKLENVRKRESALKTKEQKLLKKEKSLCVREKKISICEKTVKDKLLQAELYLKRCKENKPGNNIKYENLEISSSGEYEEVDCSGLVETSKKLNIDKLQKPAFVRTFSERKVKFKGHSPLKEMDFHRGKSIRSRSKGPVVRNTVLSEEKGELKPELFKDISNVETNIVRVTNKTEDKNRRSTLFGMKSLSVQDENASNLECRPIAWTDESKKQAFNLLRIMNSNNERQHWMSDVKHTYL